MKKVNLITGTIVLSMLLVWNSVIYSQTVTKSESETKTTASTEETESTKVSEPTKTDQPAQPEPPQVDPFQEAVEKASSSDPYIRRQSAETFGRLREPRGIPYLRKMLKDENVYVRQQAIDSLGLLRAEEVSQDLIDILIKEKETQVRQSAAIAMGYIGNKDFIVPLCEVLKSTHSPMQLRYAACNTLGILRAVEVVPDMIKLLNDPDLSLRRSVVFALGRIPTTDSIPAFRTMLSTEKDENLLAEIIKILFDKNDKESIEKIKVLYNDATVSEKIKLYAAVGLAKLANDVTVLPTIKKGLKSTDNTIRNLSIDASGYIGDKETLTMLKSMLNTEQSSYTKEMLKFVITKLEPKTTKPAQPTRPRTPKK